MQRRSRPLSPSLQIYRPQLTSVLSIAHRLTGVLLSAGAVMIVFWIATAAAGASAYAAFVRVFESPLGLVLLFLWTFSVFFHLCNGVRHLVWDAGHGFELRTIYTSGWVVLITSGLLTLVAWAAGLLLRA